MSLLHVHAAESGGFIAFLEEVLLGGLLDTLSIVPFLFLTYFLMELIEHKASDKARLFMKKAGVAGPAVGGLLGIIPQCGFSAAASNLYTGRVITLGTLIAIFLSTSDEMLLILLSHKVDFGTILGIILYKAGTAIMVGFITDRVMRLTNKEEDDIDIDAICENEGCHCERGVLYSALVHTLKVGLFALIVTLLTNTLVFFIGSEGLSSIMYDKPFVSHLVSAIIGLIPSCAVSVALTNLAASGYITVGTMLSGLFTSAGVGLLILFRINKRIWQNVAVVLILLFTAIVFGLIADVFGFFTLLA